MHALICHPSPTAFLWFFFLSFWFGHTPLAISYSSVPLFSFRLAQPRKTALTALEAAKIAEPEEDMGHYFG